MESMEKIRYFFLSRHVGAYVAVGSDFVWFGCSLVLYCSNEEVKPASYDGGKQRFAT